VNDPNRAEAPQYIVDLIGRIITVSLRTVEIVNNLPAL
jgi:predicted helicase